MPTRPSVAEQIRYDHLTWSEINQAVAQKKMIVMPIGTIQQHGPHLPVDADCLIVESLALAAAQERPAKVLVAPTLPYCYSLESMDFPGTVSVAGQTFMDFCISVVKGFAYHGFDHIFLLNGFAPNDNLVELVARQINMETGALCGSTTWANLLTVDPTFNASWRESGFPGSSHADELETSLYLALDEAGADMEKVEDFVPEPFGEGNDANLVYDDHFGSGALYVPRWMSDRTPNGVLGEPSRASVEKGRRILQEAVKNFGAVLDEFHARPKRAPVDHHTGPKLATLPLSIS